MFGDMRVWIEENSEFLSLVQIQHLGMGMSNIININIITMSGQQTDSTWRIDSHKTFRTSCRDPSEPGIRLESNKPPPLNNIPHTTLHVLKPNELTALTLQMPEQRRQR